MNRNYIKDCSSGKYSKVDYSLTNTSYQFPAITFSVLNGWCSQGTVQDSILPTGLLEGILPTGLLECREVQLECVTVALALVLHWMQMRRQEQMRKAEPKCDRIGSLLDPTDRLRSTIVEVSNRQSRYRSWLILG